MFSFSVSGGSVQRDSGEAVQDREESHQHQPRAAVWEQGVKAVS